MKVFCFRAMLIAFLPLFAVPMIADWLGNEQRPISSAWLKFFRWGQWNEPS
jgi:hypothetical protein